jgi:hypothetical protein
MTDNEAKVHVAQMRIFYQDLLGYAVVNTALILIWLFSPTAVHFWPFWTLVGWGFLMGKRALDLKLIRWRKIDLLPFMAPDWEEKQVQKLMASKTPTRDLPAPTEKKVKP